MPLLPCSTCGRHAQETAATCPFCGKAFVPGAFACTDPGARVKAAAVVGTALVLGGCNMASSSAGYGVPCIGSCYEPPVDSGRDLADATVNEGGEPDGAPDAGTAPDASSDAGAGPGADDATD